MIRAVLSVIAVFSLVIACTWLWLRLDQPIRFVRVEGAASVAEQQAVQRVLDDALVNGVLSIDLEELTTRIFALSWPREVRVRRQWPNGLVVRVQREPFVAAWGDTGFLTSAGKVVVLPGHEDDSLPILSAQLSSPAETMETFLLLQERLRASELTISGLAENVIGEWSLKLDNGVELMLGSSSLSERLRRFLVLYHRVLEQRMPAPVRVDARYQNALAVNLAEPLDDNLLALGITETQRLQESDTRNGFRY